MKENIMSVDREGMILAKYQIILGRLEKLQKEYEKMLEDDSLGIMARNVILDYLMEVDYQIRDYEQLIYEIENNNSNQPLYATGYNAIMPIIKDDKERSKIIEREELIESREEVFDYFYGYGHHKSLIGIAIISDLYKLEEQQDRVVISNVDQEMKTVEKSTKISQLERIYNLLNKIKELNQGYYHKEDMLSNLSDPTYGQGTIGFKYRIIDRLQSLSREREERLINRVNQLILKNSKAPKTTLSK